MCLFQDLKPAVSLLFPFFVVVSLYGLFFFCVSSSALTERGELSSRPSRLPDGWDRRPSRTGPL